MNENVIIALEIMAKGMAGIFIATLLIVGMVYLLSRIFSASKNRIPTNTMNSPAAFINNPLRYLMS